MTAEPQVLLHQKTEAYAELWRPRDTPPPLTVPDRLCLERATPTQWRKAANSFSKFTSTSLDGIHPRHWGMLSDPALACLSAVVEIVKMSHEH